MESLTRKPDQINVSATEYNALNSLDGNIEGKSIIEAIEMYGNVSLKQSVKETEVNRHAVYEGDSVFAGSVCVVLPARLWRQIVDIVLLNEAAGTGQTAKVKAILIGRQAVGGDVKGLSLDPCLRIVKEDGTLLGRNGVTVAGGGSSKYRVLGGAPSLDVTVDFVERGAITIDSVVGPVGQGKIATKAAAVDPDNEVEIDLTGFASGIIDVEVSQIVATAAELGIPNDITAEHNPTVEAV